MVKGNKRKHKHTQKEFQRAQLTGSLCEEIMSDLSHIFIFLLNYYKGSMTS